MLHKEKDAKATQGTGFKCYVGNRMQVLHREQVASTVNIIKMLHNEQDAKATQGKAGQVLNTEMDVIAKQGTCRMQVLDREQITQHLMQLQHNHKSECKGYTMRRITVTHCKGGYCNKYKRYSESKCQQHGMLMPHVIAVLLVAVPSLHCITCNAIQYTVL